MARVRTTITILALLLAGCRQAPATDPAPEATPATKSDLAPVTTLAGEWRVAGIDGEPLDEVYGIALSGTDDEIWWDPRCAGVDRRYVISGARIAFEPPLAKGPPPEPGSPPPPVCLVGIPPKVPEVGRALDAATGIGRTPENGVLISGGGRSLLLFSQ